MGLTHGELYDSRRSAVVLPGRQSSKLTGLATMEFPTSRLISAPHVQTSPQHIKLRGGFVFFIGRLRDGLLDYVRLN